MFPKNKIVRLYKSFYKLAIKLKQQAPVSIPKLFQNTHYTISGLSIIFFHQNLGKIVTKKQLVTFLSEFGLCKFSQPNPRHFGMQYGFNFLVRDCWHPTLKTVLKPGEYCLLDLDHVHPTMTIPKDVENRIINRIVTRSAMKQSTIGKSVIGKSESGGSISGSRSGSRRRTNNISKLKKEEFQTHDSFSEISSRNIIDNTCEKLKERLTLSHRSVTLTSAAFGAIKALYDNRCAVCGSVEKRPHLKNKVLITRLEQGHCDPNKPLTIDNCIPVCTYCNQVYRNNFIFNKRGLIIAVNRSVNQIKWQ